MIQIPMIIALSLQPLSEPQVIPVQPVEEVKTPSKAVEKVTETIVLDNFNDGNVEIILPTTKESQATSMESGLRGVLGGVRYVSVSVDGCEKDSLWCSDTRVNARKSGVLSVANSELLGKSITDINYDVDIADLREYTLTIKDLRLDDTAKNHLKIYLIANGVEYEVNKETLTYDFFGINGGDAVNITSFTLRFVSEMADDFTLDEVYFTRTYEVEPPPVPALGFNPLPFAPLGLLGFLGGNGGDDGNNVAIADDVPSVIEPIEPPIINNPEAPNTPEEPVGVPERKSAILSLLLSIGLAVKKIIY